MFLIPYTALKKKLKFPYNKTNFENRLPSEKIFIIPTRLSAYYAVLCFLLLTMSYFYENNLLYFFSFFLVSFGLTIMFLSNQFLKSVALQDYKLFDRWPNDEKKFLVKLGNQNKFIQGELHDHNFKDVCGKHAYPRLKISTVLPLGFFLTWKYSEKKSYFWIYPESKNWLIMPDNQSQLAGLNSAEQHRESFSDDLKSHRPWEERDGENKIDTKSYARTMTKLTKVMQDNQTQTIISWENTKLLIDLNKRKQQMSFWIKETLFSNDHELKKIKIDIKNQTFEDPTEALRFLTELTHA